MPGLLYCLFFSSHLLQYIEFTIFAILILSHFHVMLQAIAND